jgi:hypothetical protein
MSLSQGHQVIRLAEVPAADAADHLQIFVACIRQEIKSSQSSLKGTGYAAKFIMCPGIRSIKAEVDRG